MRRRSSLRAALERALGAQYDIQRLLGRGGTGAVYLARERSLDRLVAIKILPPQTAADAVADTEISGRIRAICGEISGQAAALETVRRELP